MESDPCRLQPFDGPHRLDEGGVSGPSVEAPDEQVVPRPTGAARIVEEPFMHLPLDPPGPCGLLGVDCEDFPAPPGALGPELPFLTVEVLVLSGDS